ncbi:phosphomannomutase/phosphoglucomutase [Chloroflexus sp.]|uniref:phosphomannomutase/phosphoglucomutase n=1 Tax=Chloroflexus sp. TaxID=1904827 RepID=UPI0026345808|nr:phosphomannomutase/phosphoglucomutase [uncultured Chloroflexus sp.]
MQVNPSIFKAYDIRGIYPTELNEEIAYLIGRAFVTFLGAETVIVGRDMRTSGPSLFDAVTRGIMDQGADVADIGMVSTDQYYFACTQLGFPGMMVTASHNPKQYNGFKMVRRMPYLLSGDEGIQDLRRLVESEAFPTPTRRGERREYDFKEQFVQKVLSLIDVEAIKPLKVIVDTGNGMVGPILQEVYARLPIQLTGMYLDPDGTLPNHGLDPLMPENRAELQQRVKAEGADIGFAFDGDGDRFFAIDDRGEFISGDFLTAILGRYLLEREPGAKILYDVRASWAVPDEVRAAGGIPLIERVGHAFIKRRMANEDAIFAGEVSGHYYFKAFAFADSGIIPSLYLLEMLSKRGGKMSELLSRLESRYFISGEINSRVSDVAAKLNEIAERYSDGTIERIDGVSVSYDTWHFNVRGSNTEPLIRLNLESIASRAEMEAKRDEVLAVIRS